MSTNNFLDKPLKGIVPPLVTPLKSIDQLDIEGLERLVEHVIVGGVSGLFVLGTTGEFSSISYRMRYEVIERVCRQVGQRIPVLVGITDTSIIESIKMIEFAAKNGASAVVAAPPFYYSVGQPELIEYYQGLSSKSVLPLYLYNMPVHTKVIIEPNTVKVLSADSNIRGLKDSSANAVYFRSVQHIMRSNPNFELFMGPEEITAEAVLLGANGGVNGGANMFPKLYVEMYEAAASHNLEEVKRLQSVIMEISSSIYTVGRYGSSYLKGLKCALSLMGICDDFIAHPFHKFKEEERSVIEKNLKALNLT